MKAPKKTTPKARHEVSVRERIFDAALRLLRKGGTEMATMRAICDEAGIKPPTLYHYFGDMHGLYLEVVERMVDKIRGTKAAGSTLLPRERIDDVWTRHVNVAQEDPGLFDLWNRHLAWDKLSTTSLRSYHELENAFEQLAHEYPLKLTPKQAAYVFWAAAHGMACLIAASHHDGVPYPEKSAEALKDGVLAMIFERTSRMRANGGKAVKSGSRPAGKRAVSRLMRS